MKKTIGILVVLIVFLFAGCTGSGKQNNIYTTESTENTAVTHTIDKNQPTTLPDKTDKDQSKITADSRFIKGGIFLGDIAYPQKCVLTSKQELEELIKECNKNNILRNKVENYPSFLEVAKEFDQTYFKSKVLVIVFLEEDSGNITHKFQEIKSVGEKETVIKIKRVMPKNPDHVKTYWNGFIEFSQIDYAGKEIKVELV